MSTSEHDLAEGFAPADAKVWRELAVRALGREGSALDEILTRRTSDGIARGPLFTSRGAAAAPSPRALEAAGGPQDIRSVIDHPDPGAANAHAREAIEGGAGVIELKIESGSQDGILVRGFDDLARTLDGVDLATTGIALEAGDLAAPAAALLAALLEDRGSPAGFAGVELGFDPHARLATRCELPRGLDEERAEAAEWALWADGTCADARAYRIDARIVHEAGGSEAWELAFAAASALAALEDMVDRGLPLDRAAGQIGFALSLDADAHLGIAKIRALRRIWARIVSAAGAEPGSAPHLESAAPGAAGGSGDAASAPICAYSSSRMLARRDPWTNIMRLTAAAFGAACGGADGVSLAPFTAALGGTNPLARRLTRNIPLVLAHECRLSRVADPACGSFHHETLTDALARRAWKHFQEIQSEGTLEKFIVDGRLHAAVVKVRAERAAAVDQGDAPLIGVSAYPPTDELQAAHTLRLEPINREAARRDADQRTAARKPPAKRAARAVPDQLIPLARDGADVSVMLSALSEEHEPYHETPLRPVRDAAPFEAIAESADAAAQAGARPAVFLACLGARANYAACANWAEGAFRVGGFAIRGGDPLAPADMPAAFAASSAGLAVVCASQKDLRAQGADAVASLNAAGVPVWTAEAPDDLAEKLRAAGAARVLRKGDSLLATLREAHDVVGAGGRS